MAEEMDDDTGYPDEEVLASLTQATTDTLETASWDETKVPQWIQEITEKSMKALIDLRTPYKWIVTVMLFQKTDKALFSCFSLNWENNSDGVSYLIYPPIRAKDSATRTIQALVTAIGVHF